MGLVDGVNNRLCLTEFHLGAIHVATFKSHLQMVCALLDNGTLGDDSAYGGPKHIEALNEVEKQLADTRATIAKTQAHEIAQERLRAILEQEVKTNPCPKVPPNEGTSTLSPQYRARTIRVSSEDHATLMAGGNVWAIVGDKSFSITELARVGEDHFTITVQPHYHYNEA